METPISFILVPKAAPSFSAPATLGRISLNSAWVVAMAAIEDYNIQYENVNIYGGAVALGHPIGASGARILTTLINGMNRQNVDKGLATLCIGGGEASALIVEKYD